MKTFYSIFAICVYALYIIGVHIIRNSLNYIFIIAMCRHIQDYHFDEWRLEINGISTQSLNCSYISFPKIVFD